MGTVPIPAISPLTLPRSDEPLLEPSSPISRVENSAGSTREHADESYSPREQEPAPDPIPSDTEAQITDKDSSSAHHISYFV
jgi:hypothetical protein